MLGGCIQSFMICFSRQDAVGHWTGQDDYTEYSHGSHSLVSKRVGLTPRAKGSPKDLQQDSEHVEEVNLGQWI